jgi:hypothetical protein
MASVLHAAYIAPPPAWALGQRLLIDTMSQDLRDRARLDLLASERDWHTVQPGRDKGDAHALDSESLTIELAPGSQITLRLGWCRYVRQPAYTSPTY